MVPEVFCCGGLQRVRFSALNAEVRDILVYVLLFMACFQRKFAGLYTSWGDWREK